VRTSIKPTTMLRQSLRVLRTAAVRAAVKPRPPCRPKSTAALAAPSTQFPQHRAPDVDPEEDDDDMEDMFVDTSMGKEWGGPTRGGRMPEPTRFGDWERKGRATDF